MDLLRDIIRSERPQFRQLDPARDASAKRRWAKLLGGCDITDLRLRNANDRVSPEFRHGPHAGLPVADLVDSFMSSEERPEDCLQWLLQLGAGTCMSSLGIVVYGLC